MKTNSSRRGFTAKLAGRLGSVSFMAALLFSGCSQQPAPENAPVSKDGSKVIIRGSNTIGEELAPQLIAEFKKEHPTAGFDLETKGTPYGMGALMGGFCDIAGASRLPSREELEVAKFRDVELNDHVIGAYSVAVVVNAGNPVANVTKEQVRDIFSGVIQNWKEVGGPDLAIHIYARDPISGTHLGFQELAMENKPYGSQEHLFTSYEALIAGVAKDPAGIGYSSFELSKNTGIKPLTVGGVEASFAAVHQGTYPYARTLHLYTCKGKETPATLDFIKFILSPRGQAALSKAGFVPQP